jgi:hypothetical protein
MLASIRPDDWNLPLFLHVLGALVLVGTVAAATILLLASARSGEPAYLRRLGFRTLLLGALPSYIVMRVGAEWLYSKEFDNAPSDPTWIGIGYGIADIGGLVFLIGLILAGVASGKAKPGLAKAAGVLVALTLVAWLVAIWAMGGKPG